MFLVSQSTPPHPLRAIPRIKPRIAPKRAWNWLIATNATVADCSCPGNSQQATPMIGMLARARWVCKKDVFIDHTILSHYNQSRPTQEQKPGCGFCSPAAGMATRYRKICRSLLQQLTGLIWSEWASGALQMQAFSCFFYIYIYMKPF